MGDTVVVGSCNGFIHGIDKATGVLRWKYDARADGGRPEFHALPLVAEDVLVMGSDDRRPDGVGFVYAIESTSGTIRWKTRIGRGSMTDVVRLADRIFLVTLDDELLALDFATGKLEWSFRAGKPTGAEDVNVIATPAVTRDRVLFGGADGGLYALLPRSGALAWKSQIGSRITTPPLLTSNALYLGTFDGRLVRLDASRGDVAATLRLDQVPYGSIVPAGKRLLFFSAERATLAEAILNAADATLSSTRWTQRAERGWDSARPYLWRGLALAGDGQGHLLAFAPEDGSLVWARQLEGVIRGIGFDGDRLFVGTLRGAVFAVSAPSH